MPRTQHLTVRLLVWIGTPLNCRETDGARRSEFNLAGVGSEFGVSLVLLPRTPNSMGASNIRSRISTHLFMHKLHNDNLIYSTPGTISCRLSACTSVGI